MGMSGSWQWGDNVWMRGGSQELRQGENGILASWVCDFTSWAQFPHPSNENCDNTP